MNKLEETKYFFVEEFVTPRHVELYGSNAKWFVSDWQIHAAIYVRAYFGSKAMTINNWAWGGNLKNRGTRLPNSNVGSFYSQHKLAMAIDFNIQGIDSKEIYQTIINNQSAFLSHGITTIENVDHTPTWIHIDGRRTNSNKIKIVRPALTTQSLNRFEIDI